MEECCYLRNFQEINSPDLWNNLGILLLAASDRLNTSSPFNIKVSSLTLRDFNAVEVQELYQQHTLDTGQVFTTEAFDTAFDLTQKQPSPYIPLPYSLTFQ